MTRAAATSDVFNAIAEPRRRDIIDFLTRSGPRPVGAVVKALKLRQPAVSKHLRVLRSVGVVRVAKRGRCRIYSVDPGELKTVYDWAKQYESFWAHQLDRIKRRAEQQAVQPTPALKRSEEHPS
jgi:DNA-binding transcriptional ArsR family regulator